MGRSEPVASNVRAGGVEHFGREHLLRLQRNKVSADLDFPPSRMFDIRRRLGEHVSDRERDSWT
jgi:hypothetical protein